MTYAIRISSSLPFAALIAISLFMMMQSLIATGVLPVKEKAAPPDIQIRFDVPDKTKVIIERTPPAPADPPPFPETSNTLAKTDLPIAPDTGFPGIIPKIKPAIDPGSELAGLYNTVVAPLVRIPPAYPPIAASQNLEGQCDMAFDVSATGTPMNIRAVSCTHRIFARTSVEAISRWKYQARIVNGVPVEMRGLRTTLSFQLDD